MLVKTNRQFFDTVIGEYRRVGDEFEVNEERFDELNELVPGFVSKVDIGTKRVIDPLDNLTVNEIKELLDAEGIEYDSKAKKEELKALLR